MRAIILAAGMGTRFRPITDTVPKSLIKVFGQPMLERQVEFLKEKGIEDIIVVTGYLKEKYNIKLVHNEKYKEYSNVYTICLLKEYLQDAYVTEVDAFMRKNYLKEKLEQCTYFTGKKIGFMGEWILHFDDDLNVYDIEVGNGEGYILSGVSYWTREDGIFIKGKLEEAIDSGNFTKLYWDDIVKNNLDKLSIRIEKINSNDWFEIDSLVDLASAEAYIAALE